MLPLLRDWSIPSASFIRRRKPLSSQALLRLVDFTPSAFDPAKDRSYFLAASGA